MKKPLNNILSPDEQKVISFLIILAIIGMAIHFSGVLSGIPNKEDANEVVYDKEFEIKLNLETVTFEDLVMIPGIGEKKAEDILDFRENFGFQTKTDLMKIKGIGEKTYKKIEEYFYLEGDSISLSPSTTPTLANTKLQPIMININTATLDELTQLKGIGIKKAGQIIELRKELGNFTNIQQLLEIRGIGELTLANIQDKITLTALIPDSTGGTND